MHYEKMLFLQFLIKELTDEKTLFGLLVVDGRFLLQCM